MVSLEGANPPQPTITLGLVKVSTSSPTRMRISLYTDDGFYLTPLLLLTRSISYFFKYVHLRQSHSLPSLICLSPYLTLPHFITAQQNLLYTATCLLAQIFYFFFQLFFFINPHIFLICSMHICVCVYSNF